MTTSEGTELQQLRRENARLREEREILKKPRPGSHGRRARSRPSLRIMKAHQAAHAIATLCQVLDVSPSGYYAWRRRGPSVRARQDAALQARVQQIHRQSRGTYGAPRIHAELAATGTRVGRKRVARLRRQAGLRGVSRRNFVRTTIRADHARPAADLV